MPRTTTPIHVLHVDDEPGFADMTADFLEREVDDLTVTTATSASDGLDRLDDADPPIDCIVSDYDMPGMDGLEFLERVREAYSDLPFILYTGKGSEEIASEAISAGVTDYLQKESGTDQYTVLANRIQQAVAKSRAERRADTYERQPQTLLETVLAMIAVVIDGEYAYVNEAGVELLGTDSRDDIVGEPIWQHIHPDHRDEVKEHVMEGRAEDAPANAERKLVREDGDIRHVERVTTAIEWEDEEATLVLLRDITERKHAQDRFEAFVTTAADILTLVDETGTIQYESPAVEHVLGYDPAELEGDDAFKYIHPDDRIRLLTQHQYIRYQPESGQSVRRL